MRVRPSGAAIVIAVAVVYCAWLGAHWLRFSFSSGELSLYASHLWDLDRELARAHRLPWWTATFQNGSSEAFVYSAGGTLPPLFLLSRVMSAVVAEKVLALFSIGAGGVTMFHCAKRFLRSEPAAVLAGLVYLFHPQLLARAGGVEHLSVVMFAPLVPLAWLTLALALDRRRFVDAFACATTMVAMLWLQPKQLLIQLLFLGVYALWSIAREDEARGAKARILATISALCVPMGVMIVAPVIAERHALKLFEGESLEGWQRMYAVANVGALIDRSADQYDYAGIVALTLAALAIVYGRERRDRGLLYMCVAFEAAALALGHGLTSVADSARVAFVSGALRVQVSLFALAFVMVLVEIVRRGLRSTRAKTSATRQWLVGAAALAAFLFVPCFRLLAHTPFFADVRAPAVFFEVPGMFFGALLAGFFVTDVLEPSRLGARAPLVVAALAVLLVLDAWPFQRWMTTNDVPPTTLANARAMYAAIGAEAAHEGGGKVYVVGGRFFHVMGPSWGGPPMVTEAGISYMAPRGTGRLAAVAGESLPLQRAYLDLVGVKWLVFDKSDPRSHTPGLAVQLQAYRKIYAVDREDDDFAVFRVPHARAYVSGYSHAAVTHGEAPHTPELAVSLAHAGYALVQLDEHDALPPEMAAATIAIDPDPALSPLPPKLPREDALVDVSVTRDTDDRLDARFTASSPCIAVIDESDYPFWHATLDGHATPILRVAYGLMGFAVAAGPHAVALTYEPPRAYAWCAIVSASSSVVFAFVAFVAFVRSRRARVTSRA